MKIDDEFLQKEAKKRRLMTILLIVLMVNFVALAIMHLSGFLYEHTTASRYILYSEGLLLGVLFLVLRKKFKES